MKEIESNEDVLLEGDLILPNARERIFNTPTELGNWLVLVKPALFQVNPTQDGRFVLKWTYK